jgi:transposase-like protein
MAALKNIEKINIAIFLLHPSVQQLLDMVHDHPEWPVSEMIEHLQNQQRKEIFSYAEARAILTRLYLGTGIERHKIHKLAYQKNKKLSMKEKKYAEVIEAIRDRCQRQKTLLALPGKISQQQRLQFLERVLINRESVTTVCQEAHISPKRWYKWLKQYRKLGSNPEAFLNILSPGKKLSNQNPRLANAILKIVVDHPEYGVIKILRELEIKKGKQDIKRFRLTTFLQHIQLDTAEKRLAYAAANGNGKAKTHTIPGVYTRLSVDEKIALMRRVFMGEQVEQLCKEAGVSQSVFYDWLKKYYNSQGSSKSLEFQRIYPKGEKHPQYIPDAARLIFEVIKIHPEYGADLISRQLKEKTGKNLIAPSTIQQFLRSQKLNTIKERKVYAKIHVRQLSP